MPMSRWTRGLLAGSTFLGLVGLAWSQAKNTPSVAEMLAFKPLQKGIVYSTPTAPDMSKCKVAMLEGDPKGATGWVLHDAKGQLLRKFAATGGGKQFNQWSYYKDGMEVYREVDTNNNGKADRFVWLNSGGMKVGVDRNEDGIIDAWAALSPEELSQEVVKAIAAKDRRILDALLVSEEDLLHLGAPAKEVARIRELQKSTPVKFQQTCAKLMHLNENSHWQHFETAAPSRLPTDATGMKQDVLMHYRGLILVETNGKHDWIQLGEMVQVGEAWKLLDAPLPGDAEPVAAANPGNNATVASTEDAVVQDLMTRLMKVDEAAPADNGPGPNPALVDHYFKRAELLELLALKAPEAERIGWWKQLADNLCSAMQRSADADHRAADRLAKLEAKLAKEMPGSEVAAYTLFHEIATDYTRRLEAAKKAEEVAAVQAKYQERLQQFVAAFGKAEETADALLELAKLYDYGNKEKEAEAKKCYELVARNFAASKQAAKANGALRRMSLEGNVWELGAPAVSLVGPAFNLNQLRGKIVVVYYWASWCRYTPADFATLAKLLKDYAGKVELVTINVDDVQADAGAFLRRTPAPGYHLYAPGGLESPLATYYGLMGFPNVFLVGADGKVVSRTVDVVGLEEELKKIVK